MFLLTKFEDVTQALRDPCKGRLSIPCSEELVQGEILALKVLGEYSEEIRVNGLLGSQRTCRAAHR